MPVQPGASAPSPNATFPHRPPPVEATTPPGQLAQIWARLQLAARTDPTARHFVDYFRADAHRLFGSPGNPTRPDATGPDS